MIAPLTHRPDVLEFLGSRRSRPAKTLSADAPPRQVLEQILTLASRVPDHGKLSPWRFAVLGEQTRRTAAEWLGEHRPEDPKSATQLGYGGAVIAVIAAPVPNSKIPLWEQDLAAGCAAHAALTAALALGWGANWLTGPLARDAEFLTKVLGCQPDEWVAGFIHIGRETVVPSERDRPSLPTITTWMD